MIVGIIGKAGSGKSTAAELIRARFNGEVVSLADPIKQIAQGLFGFTNEQLWGPSANRNAPDARFTRPDGEPLTPRYALQTLGSWGRDCYESIWIDAALRLAAKHRVAVIPDVRYPNEAEAIERAGGVLIRIVRPGAGLEGDAGRHPSETAQEGIRAHAEVLNDGTIEDLRVRLAMLLDDVAEAA